MSNTTSFRRFSWLLALGLTLGAAEPKATPPQEEASCSDAPAQPVRQVPKFGYCAE